MDRFAGTNFLREDGLLDLQPRVEKCLAQLMNEGFFTRFCQRDATLWASGADEIEEINQRLDWLDAPRKSVKIARQAEKLLCELLDEGFDHAVVLGMGGSSLAPEVYSRTILKSATVSRPHLKVHVLDTTDPGQITVLSNQLDLPKTIFIVSSKSGTTTEVNALLEYFWYEVKKAGQSHPGTHFVAITDPGTPLARLGQERGFRKVFAANPNVGGRFSALIEFGLIPAVLCGFDGEQLLKRAWKQHLFCEDPLQNEGMRLGVVLAEAFRSGRDKLSILVDPNLPSFGAWLEQLVAESSGKSGMGIVPIDEEPLLKIEQYSHDRLFVRIASQMDFDAFSMELVSHGYPVISMAFADENDLSSLFYLWEISVSVACALMGVNAFNQPNVQMSKSITTQLMDQLRRGQKLDLGNILFSDQRVNVYGQLQNNGAIKNLPGLLARFLNNAQAGDYVGINAFLAMNKENKRRLNELRKKVSETYAIPTTLGFGPRFLHSTGQLHKGGQNNGLFIVLTEEKRDDLDIPGQDITFGNLQLTQAIGDTRALEQTGRRVIRIHLQSATLEELVQAV